MNCVSLISPKRIVANPIIKAMDKTLYKRKGFHFEKVNDAFYRGSDAAISDMPTLAQKGVKTILNLKSINKEELEKLTKEADKFGIKYVNIPLNPFNTKKNIPAIITILKEATPENPLFTHCTFGIDRTGFVTALERHINENLPIYKAIKDMHEHGFKGFHRFIFCNMEKSLRTLAKQNKG